MCGLSVSRRRVAEWARVSQRIGWHPLRPGRAGKGEGVWWHHIVNQLLWDSGHPQYMMGCQLQPTPSTVVQVGSTTTTKSISYMQPRTVLTMGLKCACFNSTVRHSTYLFFFCSFSLSEDEELWAAAVFPPLKLVGVVNTYDKHNYTQQSLRKRKTK